MLPGECVKDTVATCSECGEILNLKVCKSAAGHYLGFVCQNDGPYSRESGYFVDEDAAKWALVSGAYGRRWK